MEAEIAIRACYLTTPNVGLMRTLMSDQYYETPTQELANGHLTYSGGIWVTLHFEKKNN